MFDVDKLLNWTTAPDDMTVGVVRKAFYNSPEWKALLTLYPRAMVLFKYRDGGHEVPDAMTVLELRIGVSRGTVVPSIDDGSGGQLEDA